MGSMRRIPLFGLLMLLAGCTPLPRQTVEIPFRNAKQALARPVHLVLGADTHDDLPLLSEFIDRANAASADLLIDAGDLQQYGSPGEWRAVDAHWSKLRLRAVFVPGNHEHRRQSLAHFEAVYGAIPRSLDVEGLHVVLLDDGGYELGTQLTFLAQDLARHASERTIVVMHVPLTVPVGWMRALDLIPSWHHDPQDGGSPAARKDARELGDSDHPVDHLSLPEPDRSRLLALLVRYHVDALVCGHQHVYALDAIGGIPCVHLGTVGGYLPELGESHDYLTATVTDAGMTLVDHALDRPPPNPVALVESWRAYDRMAHRLALAAKDPVESN